MTSPVTDPVAEAMARVEASLSRVPGDATTKFQSVGAFYDEATGLARLVTQVGAMRSSWNESLAATDLRLLLSALREAREGRVTEAMAEHCVDWMRRTYGLTGVTHYDMRDMLNAALDWPERIPAPAEDRVAQARNEVLMDMCPECGHPAGWHTETVDALIAAVREQAVRAARTGDTG